MIFESTLSQPDEINDRIRGLLENTKDFTESDDDKVVSIACATIEKVLNNTDGGYNNPNGAKGWLQIAIEANILRNKISS